MRKKIWLPFQGVGKETWEATQGVALGCYRLAFQAGKEGGHGVTHHDQVERGRATSQNGFPFSRE
ncbi:MAG: hypothetical protein ABFD91_09205 [Anaerohalosphaeraceae bacterium]